MGCNQQSCIYMQMIQSYIHVLLLIQSVEELQTAFQSLQASLYGLILVLCRKNCMYKKLEHPQHPYFLRLGLITSLKGLFAL